MLIVALAALAKPTRKRKPVRKAAKKRAAQNLSVLIAQKTQRVPKTKLIAQKRPVTCQQKKHVLRAARNLAAPKKR